jgi:hypothetical protein
MRHVRTGQQRLGSAVMPDVLWRVRPSNIKLGCEFLRSFLTRKRKRGHPLATYRPRMTNGRRIPGKMRISSVDFLQGL